MPPHISHGLFSELEPTNALFSTEIQQGGARYSTITGLFFNKPQKGFSTISTLSFPLLGGSPGDTACPSDGFFSPPPRHRSDPSRVRPIACAAPNAKRVQQDFPAAGR